MILSSNYIKMVEHTAHDKINAVEILDLTVQELSPLSDQSRPELITGT
jgi:hypothetical protein